MGCSLLSLCPSDLEMANSSSFCSLRVFGCVERPVVAEGWSAAAFFGAGAGAGAGAAGAGAGFGGGGFGAGTGGAEAIGIIFDRGTSSLSLSESLIVAERRG